MIFKGDALIIRNLLLVVALIVTFGCATAKPPQSLAGEYLSGRLASGVNDIGASAEHYGRAFKANPTDADLLRRAFFFHLAAGRVAEAGAYADSLAAAGDDDELGRIVVSAIRLKHGDFANARAMLSGGFAQPYARSISSLMDAWIQAEVNGPKAGIAAFDAMDAAAFTGFNSTFKAMLLENMGEIDEARSLHELSVATFGGPVGSAAYGAFLERRGDVAQARAYYARLASEGGALRRIAASASKRLDEGRISTAYLNPSANEGAAMALYLFAGNMLQQSAEELQRAENAGFKVERTPFNMPLALAQLAVHLDPSLADAESLVGSILSAYGNYDAARDAFVRVPNSSAAFEQAQIEIAGAYVAEKRTDEAIAALRSAIRRDPAAIEARLALAGYLAQLERHHEAVAAADDAIRRLPSDAPEDAWRLFITRAASLIALGQFDVAEPDLKRAVELAPKQPIVLNYLGYSWVERGINLDQAFKLIEDAVSLQPESGAIIDSLGWAYFQRGEFSAALPHLEKAASLEPADPTVTEHLGDVYWRLGREVEARFQWRRALQLDPVEKQMTAISDKLRSGMPQTSALPPASSEE